MLNKQSIFKEEEEHIYHNLLVNSTWSIDLRVVFNKLRNSINKVVLIHLLLEGVFREIRETYEDMHEHWYRDLFSDEFQQVLHVLLFILQQILNVFLKKLFQIARPLSFYLNCDRGVLLEVSQSVWCMRNIS